MSYTAAPTVERRIGTLVLVQGNRAMVRFPGTLAYAMPLRLFQEADLHEGQAFVLIVRRLGKQVLDVKVEAQAGARPSVERKGTPMVYVRTGRKFRTRR